MSYRDEHFSRADHRMIDRMVRSMIVRGVITSADDSKKMQVANLRLENGYEPSEIEHWHPYGFTFAPQSGAEVVALALHGNRDHVIVIPGADRRYRLTGLANGEVALHDDQGQKVHMKRDSVFVETDKKVVAKAPSVLVGEDDPGLPRVLTEAGPSSVLRAKV